MSDELPVITNIDDIPESALEELTCGNESVEIEKKPEVKASAKPEATVEVADEAPAVAETTEEAPAKPKRKRRTKAEIEAEKAAKASEAEV